MAKPRRNFSLPHEAALCLCCLVGLMLLGIAWQHSKTWVTGSQPGMYRVVAVMDGDTLAVDMQGVTEIVRFVGIDTPETHKPSTPIQCYGPESSAFTAKAVGRNRVRLRADPLSTNRDRYNRLLRYVYLPDGRMMNRLLLENGHAFYYPYFPFTKSSEFSSLQNTAKSSGLGLWRSCKPQQNAAGGYISNVAST